jgi:hypothetical protein
VSPLSVRSPAGVPLRIAAGPVAVEQFGEPAICKEDALFPYPSDLVDAVHEHILPLKGYTVRRPCSNTELM